MAVGSRVAYSVCRVLFDWCCGAPPPISTPLFDSSHFDNTTMNETLKHALRGFSVRRTPRACHGACNHLRPGRLRASHAVCLASWTLEPVICARKEGTDIESLSTTESILAESLVMRGDFFDTQAVSFGFYATSRHCIPRRSPRNSNLNEVTANNGAAANCSARHGSCYSYSGVSRAVVALSHVRCLLLRSTLAATAPRSAVSELESLAVRSGLRPADLPKNFCITSQL